MKPDELIRVEKFSALPESAREALFARSGLDLEGVRGETIMPLAAAFRQNAEDALLTAALADGEVVRARLPIEQRLPAAGEAVWLQVVGAHTCYYKDEELVA